jgi:membrane protein implicated in regulation of membrane protease activity
MIKVYFVFLLIGLMGLLSSMLFGDADSDIHDGSLDSGDTFDDSPKVFSLRVIFSFLLSFGIGAGSVFYYGGNLASQLLTGLGAGVAIGALTWWITYMLYRMQGASNVDSDSFIGRSGNIVIGTTKDGNAKVKINTTSGPMEFLCRSSSGKKLRLGDTVTVVEKLGTLLLVNRNN